MEKPQTLLFHAVRKAFIPRYKIPSQSKFYSSIINSWLRIHNVSAVSSLITVIIVEPVIVRQHPSFWAAVLAVEPRLTKIPAWKCGVMLFKGDLHPLFSVSTSANVWNYLPIITAAQKVCLSAFAVISASLKEKKHFILRPDKNHCCSWQLRMYWHC